MRYQQRRIYCTQEMGHHLTSIYYDFHIYQYIWKSMYAFVLSGNADCITFKFTLILSV